MASSTPKLQLRKPDGVDLVNVTTDINDNLDKLDANPGLKSVTTTQRNALAGADLWAGRMVYDSTLGKFFWYTGAAWFYVAGQEISASETVVAYHAGTGNIDMAATATPAFVGTGQLVIVHYESDVRHSIDQGNVVLALKHNGGQIDETVTTMSGANGYGSASRLRRISTVAAVNSIFMMNLRNETGAGDAYYSNNNSPATISVISA